MEKPVRRCRRRTHELNFPLKNFSHSTPNSNRFVCECESAAVRVYTVGVQSLQADGCVYWLVVNTQTPSRHTGGINEKFRFTVQHAYAQ